MPTPTPTPILTTGDGASGVGQSGIKPPQQPQPQQRPNHHASDRGLVDVRFGVIGPNDGPLELSRLCMVMVMDTSDVCVYYLQEATTTNSSITATTTTTTTTTTATTDTMAGPINDHNHHNHNPSYFLKLEHSVVTRKRRSRRDRRRALEGIQCTTHHQCTLSPYPLCAL